MNLSNKSNNINPHGGILCQQCVSAENAESLKLESEKYLFITLNKRQLCDLELLMNGAFSPLTGFMDEATYQSVLKTMRLPSGLLWPIPINLDITKGIAEQLSAGDKLALRDQEGFMVAVITISDIWQPDKNAEAKAIYETNSETHPGVYYLNHEVNEYYVGGSIEGIQLPAHYDFESLWDTPEEMRQLFSKNGWRKVVAFQTSKPMHRLQHDLVMDVAKEGGAHILLHPTVGTTKPGDLQYYARVHCYQAIRKYFPKHLAMLSLLPLAMRMAGPREAIWHAIVRQNYGCSHFIVGPDHASPPNGTNEAKFYTKYAAQESLKKYEKELEIKTIAVEEYQYSETQNSYTACSQIEKRNEKAHDFSDKKIRQSLQENKTIPDWVSYPEVLKELRKVYPAHDKLGFTLFFTGLSGSGKSTLAKIIYARLIEQGSRPVTLLDGDIVRNNLSSELGFSKEHRDLNIRRIGFVANEITKNGGVAICAPIAPYTKTRRAVRSMIEEHGDFIEIHVATPLEVCEARDRKGLYAKARKGVIKEFTGISDPYEQPEKAEFKIDTSDYSPMEAAQEILLYLLRQGYLDNSEN